MQIPNIQYSDNLRPVITEINNRLDQIARELTEVGRLSLIGDSLNKGGEVSVEVNESRPRQFMRFIPMEADKVRPRTLFVDVADEKLKYKDNVGTLIDIT